MPRSFVGFYWTLPVNWAGFRSLPKDAEAAAARSRTIRYQMLRVRRYVHESGGRLVEEIAFMDTRPDRATDAVKEALSRSRTVGSDRGAALIFVNFEEVSLWRRNPHLHGHIEEHGIDAVPLPPDPLIMDGQSFDPREHFRAWRQKDTKAMADLEANARAGLQVALAEVLEGPGRYRRMAEFLNERNIKAHRGGRWTAENVRKSLTRGRQGD